MLVPAQIIEYFSGLSGSLVHHVVALVLLALAAGLALLGWRRAPEQGGGRLAVAATIALAVQLFLLVPSVVGALFAAVPAFVLPPLDRAASFVIMAALIWACAFPRRSRAGEIAVGTLGALAVVGLGLSWVALVRQAPVGAGFYNRTSQETAWEAAKMVLVAGGLILLIFRRAAGWGAGLLMLAVMLAGLVIHFRYPPLGQDYPGAERLADFLALPLFCVVAYWRARAPLTLDVQASAGQAAEPAAQPAPAARMLTPVIANAMEETSISESTLVAQPSRLNSVPSETPVAVPEPAPAPELAEVRAEQARLSGELDQAHEAADHLRRRAEALVEQEHSRLEEIAALRADLEAARQKAQVLAGQDNARQQELASVRSALDEARRAAETIPELEAQAADARQEAEEQRQRADGLAAEVAATHTKLAGLEGQIEAMRPQLEMLDRLWVDLQVAQKQAEERATASPEAPPETLAQLEQLKQQESLLRRELETAHIELKRVGERVQQQHADLAAARQETRRAQDEAAQVQAKLEKARTKGERMAEDFRALQAEVEQERTEVTTLAELNRQQAEELDAMQADLEAAQRRLEEAAEQRHRLQADLDTARMSEGERLGGLQAGLEAAQQAEAQRIEELEAARALLAAQVAELAAARAQAEALPGVRAELEASRKSEAELRSELELSRAEAARLAAQNQAQRVQIELGEKALTEARSTMADVQRRLSGHAPEPISAPPEHTNGEAKRTVPDRTEPARLRPAEAHKPSDNGGDGNGGHPPARPNTRAYPADVTLVGSRDGRSASKPAEPGQPPAAQTQAATKVLPSCPQLGTYMDEETHYSFVSADHRCHAFKPSAEVEVDHQTAYCLCENYLNCPVFTGELDEPRLPINTQAESESGQRRRSWRSGWLGGRK